MCFQTKQKCLIYFRIKKVQFSDERVEYLLPANEDRRGPWMQMAIYGIDRLNRRQTSRYMTPTHLHMSKMSILST